jgi:Na+-transporting NADH:ubiquinone oxidoreductase subunit NqrC
MKSTAQRLLVILTLVAFAGLMQMAFAQGRGQGMRMSPQQRADTLGKQLSLDTTQVAKVAGIFEKYLKIMSDKRTELQGDMDAMRTAMTEIREKQNKEITALLTKEQAKKYEEIQKEQMQRMQNRPPRNN